jgi:crotonobetaine/carnitine-CoA ligase
VIVEGVDVPCTSLGQLARARASDLGDRFALEVAGTRLSYREIDDLSDGLASGLQDLGIVQGDRVCFDGYNCSEMVLLQIALSKLGAIWAPLNVALEGLDLEHTLTDLAAAVVVVDEDTRPRVEAALRTLPATPNLFTTGKRSGSWAAFDDLLTSSRPAPVDVQPGDPSVIMFTGGTTGRPKGAILPEFYFVAACLRYEEAWQPLADDIHFTTLPLYHNAAQHCALVPVFANGTPAYIDRWFSLRNYWKRVRDTNASTIDPMSAMVTLLVQQAPSPLDRDHRVRLSWNGCSTLPNSIAETFMERFGIPLFGTYGGTEIGGGYVVTCPIGGEWRPHANGKNWRWVDIRIADETDVELPRGQIGRILLRPKIPFSTSLGYWKAPERTVQVMQNYWYHSGDLGRIDDEGYFWFLGREAHRIRRRGENISPYEIEEIIALHPAVADVCVVGVPSVLGEDEVKAFVIASDSSLTTGDIWRWCEGRMAAFKIPRFLEFVDVFPRSESKGEVARAELRSRSNDYAADRASSGAEAPAARS